MLRSDVINCCLCRSANIVSSPIHRHRILVHTPQAESFNPSSPTCYGTSAYLCIHSLLCRCSYQHFYSLILLHRLPVSIGMPHTDHIVYKYPWADALLSAPVVHSYTHTSVNIGEEDRWATSSLSTTDHLMGMPNTHDITSTNGPTRRYRLQVSISVPIYLSILGTRTNGPPHLTRGQVPMGPAITIDVNIPSAHLSPSATSMSTTNVSKSIHTLY